MDLSFNRNTFTLHRALLEAKSGKELMKLDYDYFLLTSSQDSLFYNAYKLKHEADLAMKDAYIEDIKKTIHRANNPLPIEYPPIKKK